MEKMTKALLEYCEGQILPLYLAHDKAHGPEHVHTVIQNSLELAEQLPECRGVDLDMVYTVAVYHDVGIR